MIFFYKCGPVEKPMWSADFSAVHQEWNFFVTLCPERVNFPQSKPNVAG
jgi:hypothetical protein